MARDRMSVEQYEDEKDRVLRERFGKISEAFKERFEMTKSGVEPLKDEDKRRKRW